MRILDQDPDDRQVATLWLTDEMHFERQLTALNRMFRWRMKMILHEMDVVGLIVLILGACDGLRGFGTIRGTGNNRHQRYSQPAGCK